MNGKTGRARPRKSARVSNVEASTGNGSTTKETSPAECDCIKSDDGTGWIVNEEDVVVHCPKYPKCSGEAE